MSQRRFEIEGVSVFTCYADAWLVELGVPTASRLHAITPHEAGRLGARLIDLALELEQRPRPTYLTPKS